MVTCVTPVAANTSPRAAVVSVIAFGIRRVRRSTTAPPPSSSAVTAHDTASDGASNDVPQDVLDLLAHRRDGARRRDGDERGQHRVLGKILSVLGPHQTAER